MTLFEVRLKFTAVFIAFCMSTLPALSEDIGEALLKTVPPALGEWSLETGSKETDADGMKAFGMYALPAEDRLFVVEIDAGGQIVTTMAGTWDFMMLTAEVVEIGSLPYQIGPDGFTTLIDSKILIRAYAPNSDERDMIKLHLDGLDVGALADLAAQLK
ncbi:hypothetical protein N9L47_13250 [Rhodobacteraceae bacterium]|nr:hypothetical protein [Paracoccaceae bacterium]